MSMAPKTSRDIVIFRALFVFTRPITHAQFANCRACALKNRKPKKWHPVFDYPRARGISIPLTVNARGLWGRDWKPTKKPSMRTHFAAVSLHTILVPRAYDLFCQRWDRRALVSAITGCREIHDIR